jgi:hypothetical protein
MLISGTGSQDRIQFFFKGSSPIFAVSIPSLTDVHMFPNKKFRPLDDTFPGTGQVPPICDVRTALETDLPVTSEYLEIDLFVPSEQLKPDIFLLRQNSCRQIYL